MAEKRGLGRGLSALIGDTLPEEGSVAVNHGRASAPDRVVPIESVQPNADQPRRNFTPEDMENLANSIREKGILQPLLVRPVGDGTYQIVAGERRWRAAQMAQLHEVPVLVRDYSDEEMLEIAIIENIQRADLNAIEEAAGYQQLMQHFGHTQEQLAQALSKSRSHIANLLRLLNLPGEVQDMVQQGMISAGHARALITADDPTALARQVVKKGLSVRQTEQLAKSGEKRQPKPSQPKVEKDADTLALEGDLSASLRMRVSIDHAPDGGGRLTVRYDSLDDLDELCQALTRVERLAH